MYTSKKVKGVKKEFCTKCGILKTRKVEHKSFSEKTGEKNFHMACPNFDSVDCIHEHDYQKPKGWFQADRKCTKCGDEFNWPCY